MTIHFPPSSDELLDCRYGGCGRTGAHGFNRDDHRTEHYERVHGEERDFRRLEEEGEDSYWTAWRQYNELGQ